jgi:hypothetical protein
VNSLTTLHRSPTDTTGRSIVNPMRVTNKINSERPDIAAQKFDFETSADGSLKVVSDTMSKSDKDWLQQQLNGDKNLVSLANKFDSLLVQGYSSDYQLKSPEGEEDSGNFQKDANTTYNYNNLASTIAGSVKFVDLMNQLQGNEKVAESQPHVTSVSYTDPATGFYGSAGYVAQQFLPANITQNVLGSDGQWEPTQRVGTIVSDWM